MSERTQNAKKIEREIEERLAGLDPAIELIPIERPGGDLLRLYIDHPDGVGLDLCERVTGAPAGPPRAITRSRSPRPDLDRPLTKPEHYERFAGHRSRSARAAPIDGQRNFTGRLEAAGADTIKVETGGGPWRSHSSGIHRSNLVPELSEVQS